MTILFDKKLAELDAYLQMLIEQTKLLDRKLDSEISDIEKNGLLSIKNNLESFLGSIEHTIVLLQIAKVSIKTTTPPSATRFSHSSLSSSTSETKSKKAHIHSSSIEGEEVDEDDDDAFFDAADEGTILATTMPSNNIDIINNNNNNNIIINNEPSEDGVVNWDELYEEEEEDLGSLENQSSVIKHLLSQIRIGMDLTKVVLPTFILERRSLLEMYADFFAHPDLFSTIPDYESPEERMVQLVKWYLSAFHAGRKSSVAKKPYNPILGEIFLCHWNMNLEGKDKSDDQSNTSTAPPPACDIETYSKGLPQNNLLFVAEQVSHHPPVSAFYAENREKLISCCSHIYTKSKYLGFSVGVHNIGQGVIKLLKHNETYVCTFPSAYGRSILTIPWVELGGSVNISCEQTGYSASIEFVTKPFYGGKKHRVMGEILKPNKEPLMTIDGEWNGVMYSKSAKNSNEKQVFVDTTCLPVIKKQVRSISSQETFESRNVWKEVTRALKQRDVNGATAAKSYIEQRQRDLLKGRLENGTKWKTRYFEATDDGWNYTNSLADRFAGTKN